jgi:protein-tyrosine kinase
MSRIHEAVKKAELERATQTISTGPFHAPGTADEAARSVAPQAANAVDVLVPNATHLATNGPLGLEDLWSRCATPPWHPRPNMNVFSRPEITGDAAEQFRTLRSRLYQLRSIQQLRTILVTSAMVGDGKTFAVSNLAQSIVRQPGCRVLIIDGDLRASRLNFHLGAPMAPGLSDYLRGDMDELEVMQRGEEGSLFLIPGGSEASNPSELLSNGRLKALLERMAPLFDWIIVDSPPCVPVADARLLAGMCDGVLLVIRAGSTTLAGAQKASQELHGTNIVGVLLNSVEKDAFEYTSYYGSAYDARTAEKEPKKKLKMFK